MLYHLPAHLPARGGRFEAGGSGARILEVGGAGGLHLQPEQPLHHAGHRPATAPAKIYQFSSSESSSRAIAIRAIRPLPGCFRVHFARNDRRSQI